MKRLIPSMFHRRLVLIGGAVGLAVVALGAQLGRLTLARGEELRDRAEARLRYAEWLPTSRGRILDRRGRVLAHDRASYRVAVDYVVISGEWARLRATEFARRAHRAAWRRMGVAEREAVVERYRAVFDRHLESAWARLSAETGVGATELGDERRAVVESVGSMVEHLRGLWERDYRREQARSGRAWAGDDDARLRRILAQPISEQRSAHVVIRSVSDEIAFALLRLADERVVLDVLGTGDSGDGVEVALIPGLVVEDGTTREYPFESVVVDVDQRTMPLPLRADGRRSVAVVGLMSDVLGWMGTPTAEVMEARRARLAGSSAAGVSEAAATDSSGVDLGQYRAGDLAGTRGIEGSMEWVLRGLRGQRIVRRDTGEVVETLPTAGRDVALTIDAMLQARVQAAMSPELGLARVQAWHGNHAVATGTGLEGAAVVLDVDSGEILALVSTPGATQAERRRAQARVDERVRLEREARAAWEVARSEGLARMPAVDIGAYAARYNPGRDPDALLRFNKALGVAYAPGSIAKVVVLLEAVRRGAYDLGERIACTGHLLAGRPDMLRCWIFKRFNVTHSTTFGHDLSAVEAMAASCNVFFYTLGRRLGSAGIEGAYRSFGVGEAYRLGIGPAAPGQVEPTGVHDAIMMGIGQGPVTWTPLHAADALATIARGGVRVPPTLVAGGTGGSESEGEPVSLGYSVASIRAVLEGLDGAVHDGTHGTGNHLTFVVDAGGRVVEGQERATREIREDIFNVPGVRLVGKTGTATSDRSVVVLGRDGRPLLDEQGQEERAVPDHSWFVVLVGPSTGAEAGRLKYAIAVMMENAGSGGKVSGPICNQIVWALVEEGYLPRVGGSASAGAGGRR